MKEEIQYLKELSKRLKRPLTDAEVFGFSQVNSEHCRHKIFNGQFVIDGEEKEESLFKMIREKLLLKTLIQLYQHIKTMSLLL